jgi:hypothetical protein
MVKEADLNRIDLPEDYEVLDATAWAGCWDSSGTQCLLTSPGETSGAYLAPTACLPWGRSGTRRASKSGKRETPKRVLNGLDRFVPFGPDYMEFDGQAPEKAFTGLIALNEVHCERLPRLHIWR